MNGKANFAGVILAGGKSSRMQTDKALLTLSGQTMLERKRALLESLGAKKVVVCRNESEYLNDITPHQGPMGGIHSVLEHFKRSKTIKFLLILPVDMPLLDEPLLSHLLNNGLAMQCPLHFDNYQLPLFIPNNEDLRKLAKRVANAEDDRSIRRFLNFNAASCLRITQEQKLLNTNDPSQWQHALTLHNDHQRN